MVKPLDSKKPGNAAKKGEQSKVQQSKQQKK
ncbi:hypothetical protein J2T59_001543 [Methanosalsum natronophilum]|nr:hypothetical protein [Methanosalsum natronophilum]